MCAQKVVRKTSATKDGKAAVKKPVKVGAGKAAYLNALKYARDARVEDALKWYAIAVARLEEQYQAGRITEKRGAEMVKTMRAKISDQLILGVNEERERREKLQAQVKAANQSTKPQKKAADKKKPIAGLQKLAAYFW